MKNTAAEIMVKARTTLVLDYPFFGCLALKLKMEESATDETMSVDGRTLRYNAAFVEGLPFAHVLGVYMHEVLHCALCHHTRREERDADRWNDACDYVINPMVLAAGGSLPDGCLIDASFAKLTAEQIYTRLAPPPPAPQSDDEGQEEAPQGDSKGDAAPQPGAVCDAPEKEEDDAEWQVAVKQATQIAKMMGDLPEGFAQMVEAQTRPKADWKAILHRFAQQSAASDYSWRMPNRRYIAQGIYLPEIRSEQMGPMVLYLDTSGSTAPFMAQFLAEFQSVVDAVSPERVYLVHCDAKVHDVQVFERGEPIDAISPKGGGGTSFLPAFQWATDNDIQPACAVFLTDGEGVYPEHAPEYPVLWALSNEYRTPWGENVVLN